MPGVPTGLLPAGGGAHLLLPMRRGAGHQEGGGHLILRLRGQRSAACVCVCVLWCVCVCDAVECVLCVCNQNQSLCKMLCERMGESCFCPHLTEAVGERT